MVSDSPPNPLAEQALAYAGLGWHIFPCKPRDKVPATRSGFKDASSDAASVAAWWAENPAANVAVACGASGLVVVDADGEKGLGNLRGVLESLDLDEASYPRARTGGGVHLFFRAPADGPPIGCRAGLFGGGVDVKGDGGYVVLPPSVHPGGSSYEWIVSPWDEELVELPPALAQAIVSCSPARAKKKPDPARGDAPIPEGRRNETLTALAGSLRRHGSSEGEIVAALRLANERRCRPPLPEKDLETIAASVARYDPAEKLPYALTDVGNAELFAGRHGDVARYDHRHERWLVWNGCTWGGNDDGVVTRLAIDCTRSLREEAARIDAKDLSEKVFKWALRSEDEPRVRRMLRLAQDLPPVADDGSGWDLDPYLLGVDNGVVDLRAGELHPGRADDRITRTTGHELDLHAEGPRWERFLKEVFVDAELIAWVQLAVGYSLTGDTSEQCFFLCYGRGANGKSKFFNALARAFGSYACNVPFAAFEPSKTAAEAASPVLASLDGARFVTASEVRETSRLNEARLKELTGEGLVTARHLYGGPFTFQPRLHLWLAVNHRPAVRDDTEAFWRRACPIPFTQTFTGDRVDPFLEHTLADEAPGILRWAVEGAAAWYEARQKAGGHLVLGYPPGGEELAAEWRRENDPLAEFLSTRCVRGEQCLVRAGSLYEAYVDWCDDEKISLKERMTKNKLGRRVSDLGNITKGHDTKGLRIYWGIGLKSETCDDF